MIVLILILCRSTLHIFLHNDCKDVSNSITLICPVCYLYICSFDFCTEFVFYESNLLHLFIFDYNTIIIFLIHCELKARDCLSQPCQNNGTCLDYIGKSYTCSCPKNFTGVNCQCEYNNWLLAIRVLHIFLMNIIN